MAHIGNLMVHHISAAMNPSDAFIYGESSAKTHDDRNITFDNNSIKVKDQPDFVWRMHKSNQNRKYNLFPSRSHEKIVITGPIAKKKDNSGPELTAAMAAIGSAREKPQQPRAAPFPKEQKLERRKKPSVTDLRFMAAIHEASMDSPTIPGRFPVHERSTSAPGHHSWRQSDYAALNRSQPPADTNQCSATRPQLQRSKSSSSSVKVHSGQRSAKTLAPLVIPSNTDLFPKRTLRRLSEQSVTSDTPPEVPPKSARMLPVSSPQSASTAPPTSAGPSMSPFSPFTPFSAPLTVPTMTFKSPDVDEGLFSTANAISQDEPAPLLGTKPDALPRSTSQKRQPSPIKHDRGRSESSMLLNVSKRGHKRSGSETSTIKQRKRSTQRPPPLPGSNPKDSFEALPSGFPAAEASTHMAFHELIVLGEQALGQAIQFEVLSATHVKRLSKELRSLDERCDYLRNTHRSLRSGRRNLHSRICDYLRSSRTAKFSFDSLFKQEEALAELDASIDEWFGKLELSENRRMRVRQKLLEHVAAALLLPANPISAEHPLQPEIEVSPAPTENQVAHNNLSPISTTRERGPAWLDPMTPCTIKVGYPHFPAECLAHPISAAPISHHTTATICSSSPAPSPVPAERLALPTSAALSSHPITPQPTITINLNPSSPTPSWLSPTHEIIKCYQNDRDSYSTVGRPSAESIRIYAGEEVYALLADVEEQIERMSMCCNNLNGNGRKEMELLKPSRYEGVTVKKPSPLRMVDWWE